MTFEVGQPVWYFRTPIRLKEGFTKLRAVVLQRTTKRYKIQVLDQEATPAYVAHVVAISLQAREETE